MDAFTRAHVCEERSVDNLARALEADAAEMRSNAEVRALPMELNECCHSIIIIICMCVHYYVQSYSSSKYETIDRVQSMFKERLDQLLAQRREFRSHSRRTVI